MSDEQRENPVGASGESEAGGGCGSRVQNRMQAEEALRELTEIRRDLERMDAACEARVALERSRSARASAPLAARAARLERDLGGWAAGRLDGRGGSLVLEWGEVRCERSVKLNTMPGANWAQVVARLREEGRDEALIRTERPDPAALAALGEAELRSLGVVKSAARRFVVATKPAPSSAFPRRLEEVEWTREACRQMDAGK